MQETARISRHLHPGSRSLRGTPRASKSILCVVAKGSILTANARILGFSKVPDLAVSIANVLKIWRMRGFISNTTKSRQNLLFFTYVHRSMPPLKQQRACVRCSRPVLLLRLSASLDSNEVVSSPRSPPTCMQEDLTLHHPSLSILVLRQRESLTKAGLEQLTDDLGC